MPAKASAAAAAAAQGEGGEAKVPGPQSILQTRHVSLQPPHSDEHWSAWYSESKDAFSDFTTYEPAATAAPAGIAASGGSARALSARQISGQFDDVVAKQWDEDWEDEDVEDTFDHIMGQLSRIEASRAAAAGK